jgi:hypothetical protein
MNLTKLRLPIGSETDRLTLTQTEVDTLIRVYYSQTINQKQVSGYVYKSSLTAREHYLLTQLGLDVLYDTLVADLWTFASDVQLLNSGESATLSVGGELTEDDVVMAIDGVTVNSGNVTQETAAACFGLTGNTLTFDKGNIGGEFMVTATVSAHPVWNADDVKTVQMMAGVKFRTVWINPDNLSAALDHDGGLTMLEDYVQRCKCYVFTADGSKKAEIKSATFSGNYSGMTAGTVTFADDTVAQVSTLNAAGCNFMVLRPALHIWSGKEDGAEVLKCTGAYDLLGEGKKRFPKKYIGMFKAFNQSGVLKSQPNRIPTGMQTIVTFQSQAKAGADGYGLWNYTDWCKENALHLAWFANTNYEVNVGTGRIGGDNTQYNRVRNIVTGFTLPYAGKYQCAAAPSPDSAGNYVNSLNFFGIEGMGEQIWEFVIGFRHNGEGTAFVWDKNEWSETHAADRTIPLRVTSASNTYIKTIIAGQHFDMMPRAVNASATTGMCDGHWISNTGRLLYVGCNAYNGSLCGLSASDASDAFSYSAASLGARLAFYGEPEDVSGSEFVAAL